ncbi:SMI1/KNR4 family protein [Prosthecobacter sp.]|jgi:hypothetical protein|uniref:SMI1/KNR4 family protein n=1 Tax=Prosthecobacter sp. TaxID=1965333 RepID=UPI0037848848
MSLATELSGPPCRLADIRLFEEFANLSLPLDYAGFLLEHNGCVPAATSDTFSSRVELPGGNQITIHQLFSLSKNLPQLRCLFEELEVSVGFLPISSIAIGIDSFGNVIALDCETGLLSWIVCESRFPLDYHRDFELGITFSELIRSLRPGPYAK